MGIDARPTLTLCSPNSGPNTSTKQADAAELKLEEKREGLLIQLLFAAKNLADFQIRYKAEQGAVICHECGREQAAGRRHEMFCRTGHLLDVLAGLEQLSLEKLHSVTGVPFADGGIVPSSARLPLVGEAVGCGPFLFPSIEGARCECEAPCSSHGVEGCGRDGASAYTVGHLRQRLCVRCAEAALRYCHEMGLAFIDHDPTPAPIGGAA